MTVSYGPLRVEHHTHHLSAFFLLGDCFLEIGSALTDCYQVPSPTQCVLYSKLLEAKLGRIVPPDFHLEVLYP